MKVFYKSLIVFSLILFGSLLFAQDSNISVEPTFVVFEDIDSGSESELITITLENSGFVSGVTIGTITIDESQSSHFNISTDNCSGISLNNDSSCSLQVKFTPQSDGIKSSVVYIPYGESSAILSVFLSNHEDTKHEVTRRLSPVIYELDIPEEMDVGNPYLLTWKGVGYHDSYDTRIVMFDCTDVVSGTCGSSYSNAEKFYESSSLSPIITEGDWSYSGQKSKNFTYAELFNVPFFRANSFPWAAEGTPIVIRFYVLSDEDSDSGKSSLSLIIPGGLSNDYYDTSGRKIQKIICPDGGCTP